MSMEVEENKCVDVGDLAPRSGSDSEAAPGSGEKNSKVLWLVYAYRLIPYRSQPAKRTRPTRSSMCSI